MEQTRRLFPDVVIYAEVLDLFRLPLVWLQEVVPIPLFQMLLFDFFCIIFLPAILPKFLFLGCNNI